MNIVVSNIKRIMREKGLKQKYVAQRSDFSEQEFSNMMNGRKKIETEYINRICYVLNAQPNDLFANADQ